MSTLAEARAQAQVVVSRYVDRPWDDMVPFTVAAVDLARDVLALPDSEVPRGKVLVDEADLRVVCDWMSPLPVQSASDHRARRAFLALAAALPAPEWEPRPEQVEQYVRTSTPYPYGDPAQEIPDDYLRVARENLKIARTVLNPEVTG